MTTLRDKVLALVDDVRPGPNRTHTECADLALAVARMVAEHCAVVCESEGRPAPRGDSISADGMTFYCATGACAAAIRKEAEGLK